MESFVMNQFVEADILRWFDKCQLDAARQWYVQGRESIERNQRTLGVSCLEILLVVSDPQRWIGLAFAAIEMQQRIWFGSPNWKQMEWGQLPAIVEPDLCFTDSNGMGEGWSRSGRKLPPRQSPAVLIPTGGSSGNIKFAWHNETTLNAAVRGMCRFYLQRDMQEGDFSYDCDLPLWHVSGWMQVYRAFRSHSILTIGLGDGIKGIDFGEPDGIKWQSVVPVQLRRMFAVGDIQRLKAQDYTIIGGGACPRDLLLKCLAIGVHPWVTYGMTETGGMVAGKQICDESSFRMGADIFPHVEIDVDPLKDGEILLRSDSLCLGYNTSKFSALDFFQTGDLGRIEDDGTLHLLGRKDRLINSGGEKILPDEVEAAIRSHPDVDDCVITSMSDEEWGSIVVCVFSGERMSGKSVPELKQYLKSRLASFKIPKRWAYSNQIAYNSKGKISKQQIQELIKKTDILR